MATKVEAMHEVIVRRVLEAVAGMSLREVPPIIGAQIHRIVREVTGNDDPYAEVKRRSNRFAMDLYEALRRDVIQAADPFETAVRYAIAGNVIDFGPTGSFSEEQVHEALEDCRNARLDRTALEFFRDAARKAGRILFIGDNAGEIVFDLLLLEQLNRERVVYAVRGGPVINDATMADAVQCGMIERVPVVDSGSDVPGTVLEFCSPEFREIHAGADLVISKGQGNYETLSETDRRTTFLFRAKCPVIAVDIGCTIGDTIVAMS
jgi:uncharacterized protein with ATP-grasp and redox domains